MATNYGIPDADSVGKKEYFDEPEILEPKIDLLATWIRECKHCLVFTGAGISTSTGIPDFRSGMNTVLSTGPGVWELRDKCVQRPAHARTISSLQAIPSVAHMALVRLQQEGLVQYVVSQNTDGLHMRSGLPINKLAELHGNTNLEKCRRCKGTYLRDYRVRNSDKVHEHLTGRLCDDPKCRGRLEDTIINFGENLPGRELDLAFEHAERADLCIVLGSSLRVTPASDVPRRIASRNQKLVIVNLQKTPLHSVASLAIHAMCDDLMRSLTTRLGLEIPKWELQRRLEWTLGVTYDIGRKQVHVSLALVGLAIDKNIPYSFVKQAIFSVTCQGTSKTKTLTSEPFSAHLQFDSVKAVNASSSVAVKVELRFHGHYGEIPLVLTQMLDMNESTQSKFSYCLFFDPVERVWRVQ